MKKIIHDIIEKWIRPPFDEETQDEIQELIRNGHTEELEDRFYTQLEFGTGGLRGIIGAGTNRMNRYTVGMATQGLANYLISKDLHHKGIVIARDSRQKSNIFATEAAAILAENGIRVYYFEDIMPVPLASFAIRFLNAAAGIVITASHNPPEYNGYKVFWTDGAQVVPPQDKEIINEVQKITDVSMIKSASFAEAHGKGMISLIGEDIVSAYSERVKASLFSKPVSRDISIAYSPIHGTGYKIVPQMLKALGFNAVYTVAEQNQPDGTFPTVEYPNPEESDAMQMVVKEAEKRNCNVAIASDPDSDRVGVAVKDPSDNYMLLNGNQIGSMLLYYILLRRKEENSLSPGSRVIKTIVTTDLQSQIAQEFGCTIDEVLTGFKWIAFRMKDFDKDDNSSFLFGGEESYGYLCVDFVRDKDAVSSICFFADMVDWLAKSGKTPWHFLQDIYLKFGLYMESLRSLTLKGKDGMERIHFIMNSLRNNPPERVAGEELAALWDLKKQTYVSYINNTVEQVSHLPQSNVLVFYLKNGAKFTVRPSGTEPKIKFYFGVKEIVNEETISEKQKQLKNYCDSLEKGVMDLIETL